MKKKLFALATALMLTVSMIVPETAAAYAEGTQKDPAESTLDEIAEQFGDPNADPFRYTVEADRKKAIAFAADALPDKLDLRNYGGTSYVTPVKFQNPWGNCWCFAAVAAAETSILGDDDLRGDFVADIRKTADPSKVQMDLSEKQATYFARTPINDPSNPQNGEGETGIPLMPGESEISASYNFGGFAPTATMAFASGVGPVLESENEIFEYRGKEGNIQTEWVGSEAEGGFEQYCYSENDDWSIDESLRFSHSFDLGESFVLPSPADVDSSGPDNIYRYDAAGTAAIKEQLAMKRGVEIGYLDDTFNAFYTDHGEYINSNFAQYTFEPEGARHAVCVVGWDDNYSRENFGYDGDGDGQKDEETMPPADMFPDGQKEGRTDGGNGAFLVKNSWGSGEESFPNKGEGTWGVVDPETGKHTGYFWLSYYDKSIATPEALDFEAQDDPEEYTDVTDQHDFVTAGHYLSARVKKEVRAANVFKAAVSEKVKKVSCETVYPGTEVRFDVYLLADGFESPTDGLLMDSLTRTFPSGGFHKVGLSKPFLAMKGQSYAVVVSQKVPEESGKVSYVAGVKLSTGETVINKGESLLFADGKWQDLSGKKLRNKLTEDVGYTGGADHMDNFPIKAFAEEMPDVTLDGGYGGMIAVEDPEDPEEKSQVNFKVWLTNNAGADLSGKRPVWTLDEGGEEIVNMIDGRDPSRKTLTFEKLGWTYLIVSMEDVGTRIFPIRVYQGLPSIKNIKTGGNWLKVNQEEKPYPGIDGYEVFYRVKGTSDWSVKEFAPGAALKVAGLKKGKRYQVKVRSFVESKYGRYYSVHSITETSGKIGLKNTLKAAGKTVKVRYAKVKKSKQVIARKKAIKVAKAKGKVTYVKIKGMKKITVNKKTGKLTVKKGVRKGSHKIRIRVRAAGKGAYLPGVKTVTVTIKVK